MYSKLNIVKHSFSLSPYLKGISRLGINTDRLVFNPTYTFSLKIESLNFIKSPFSTNLHQIPSHDPPSSPPTAPSVPTLASRREESHKTHELSRTPLQPRLLTGVIQTLPLPNHSSSLLKKWPSITSTIKTDVLLLMVMLGGIHNTRSRSELSVPEHIMPSLWETCSEGPLKSNLKRTSHQAQISTSSTEVKWMCHQTLKESQLQWLLPWTWPNKWLLLWELNSPEKWKNQSSKSCITFSQEKVFWLFIAPLTWTKTEHQP